MNSDSGSRRFASTCRDAPGHRSQVLSNCQLENDNLRSVSPRNSTSGPGAFANGTTDSRHRSREQPVCLACTARTARRAATTSSGNPRRGGDAAQDSVGYGTPCIVTSRVPLRLQGCRRRDRAVDTFTGFGERNRPRYDPGSGRRGDCRGDGGACFIRCINSATPTSPRASRGPIRDSRRDAARRVVSARGRKHGRGRLGACRTECRDRRQTCLCCGRTRDPEIMIEDGRTVQHTLAGFRSR